MWFTTHGVLDRDRHPRLEGTNEEEAMQDAVKDVSAELAAATLRFGPMASPHEGWAVIREELDELWEHVKANTGRSDDARQEAIQVAATALRYATDLCRWT